MAEESVDLRKKRAKSSTLPEELEKLAEDKDELVRFYLAGNTNTPISLLEKLAQDEDEDVQLCSRKHKHACFAAGEAGGGRG